mmetsp:Transcript_1412/g.3262  ORF Transcript_1412/g.3262 Transcript_1412/m.3262 type:complete len:267 (+) Transcript_1412:68-868(+)
MTWESYARFQNLSVDADTASSDDDVADNPHTEEGMMKAFVCLHELRLKTDAQLNECGLADTSPDAGLDDVNRVQACVALNEYDNISNRILAMDGAKDERQLHSVGHAIEVSHCRSSAARIAYFCQSYGLAMQRSSQAVRACSVAFDSIHKQPLAISLLQETLVDALVLRSMTSLQQGSYNKARQDALLAHAKSKYVPGKAEETLRLAVRCEMALKAGGPGANGEGCPLTPEAVCALQLDNVSTGEQSTASAMLSVRMPDAGLNDLD